jgi:hypothetical protein
MGAALLAAETHGLVAITIDGIATHYASLH